MKRYHGENFGTAGPGDVTVQPNGYDLSPRNDLRNHSPDGFQAGYHGSGPAQLALAIVADLYPDDVAVSTYQEVKRELIAELDVDTFVIKEEDIREIVDDATA